MLDERDAKPLAVLSSLVVPWDVFVFGGNLGWGVTLLAVQYIRTPFGSRVTSVVELARAYQALGPSGETGLLLAAGWGVSVVLVGAAAVAAVAGRLRGSGSVGQDRAIGAALAVAGSLFVLTRVAGNGRLLWQSLPAGALYVTAVGVVVYYGWLGDLLGRVGDWVPELGNWESQG